MPMRKPNKYNDLLIRAVTEVVPRQLAEAKLATGKKLRVYLGIDPTGAKLHLGHAVPLRKLRAWQEAGHEVILVIGSFTAMIGDPTGQDTMREPLTKAQIKRNYKTYQEQASKVINLKKVEVRYNHDWLEKLSAAEIMKLASNFTVQQMLERDMFRDRMGWKVICAHCGKQFNSPIQFVSEEALKTAVLTGNTAQCPHCGHMTPCNKENIFPPSNPVSPHEFLYPLMVAYDSVVLDVDAEIGGNDQLFNMLCGRKLQKVYGKRDKFVLTTKLLEGTDGRKMSKTYNNAIYLTDEPNEMYGKVMSIKDELIVSYFELCTDLAREEIKEIEAGLKKGDNPKKHKERLAKEIVEIYHGEGPSKAAEEEFEQVHKNKELPSDMPVLKISEKVLNLDELMVRARLATSKSEAKRLAEQGGVRVNSRVVTDSRELIYIKKTGTVIQVGPRKFVKFILI